MKWFLIILLLVIPVAIREIWLRYLAVIRDPMGNPIQSAGGNAFAGGELVEAAKL